MRVIFSAVLLAAILFVSDIYADSSALLANSDFEQGHDGMSWWASDSSGSGSVELNSDYNNTPNGEWSLKISSPEGGKATQNFFAEPGRSYSLNGYIMSPYDNPISGDGARACIRLVWRDASGNQVGEVIDSPASVSGPSAWQNVSIDNVTAPEGAMYGEFSFVLENASSGAAYFDNAYYVLDPDLPEEEKSPFANINAPSAQSVFNEAEPGGRTGTPFSEEDSGLGVLSDETYSGGGGSSQVPECSTAVVFLSGLFLLFGLFKVR